MQAQTFDQFLKVIREGTEAKQQEVYEIFAFGQKERFRHREKAKKRYAKLKENKNRQSE